MGIHGHLGERAVAGVASSSGEGTLMTDLVELQMPEWFVANTVATAYVWHLPLVRYALIRSEAERG